MTAPDVFHKNTSFDHNTVITHACKECRLHHKSCSGGRPCQRCAEKGLVCESVARKRTVRKKQILENRPTKVPEQDSRQQLYQSMHDILEQSYIKLYKNERKRARRSASRSPSEEKI
jgi:hypothetical protein